MEMKDKLLSISKKIALLQECEEKEDYEFIAVEKTMLEEVLNDSLILQINSNIDELYGFLTFVKERIELEVNSHESDELKLLLELKPIVKAYDINNMIASYNE